MEILSFFRARLFSWERLFVYSWSCFPHDVCLATTLMDIDTINHDRIVNPVFNATSFSKGFLGQPLWLYPQLVPNCITSLMIIHDSRLDDIQGLFLIHFTAIEFTCWLSFWKKLVRYGIWSLPMWCYLVISLNSENRQWTVSHLACLKHWY